MAAAVGCYWKLRPRPPPLVSLAISVQSNTFGIEFNRRAATELLDRKVFLGAPL